MADERRIDTVVFDVGNVLLNWSPLNLYETLIPDPVRRAWFLNEVCTTAWNNEQDRGRSWIDAVAEAIARHPTEADLISAYHLRWQEMVTGPIPGSVTTLRALAASGVPLYALTNFSAEKFVETTARFPFFSHFDGWIVSGEEGVMKPDPEIFHRLVARFEIDPTRALFIDDSAANIATAQSLGFTTHHFDPNDQSAAHLIAQLQTLDLPTTPPPEMAT